MDSSSLLRFDYSRVMRVLSTSCGSSSEPAMFAHVWLRQCHMVLRPHLYGLSSRFTIVGSLYWVLGLCGVGPVFSVTFALIARTFPAPILVLALRSAAMWCFFPQFRGFRASFGDFCPCFGILALPLLFLGYVYGVALFAPSAYYPLFSILR